MKTKIINTVILLMSYNTAHSNDVFLIFENSLAFEFEHFVKPLCQYVLLLSISKPSCITLSYIRLISTYLNSSTLVFLQFS